MHGAPALSGAELRDAYWRALETLSFRLLRRRGESAVLGPCELLRFGQPRVEPGSVEWPIEGGMLAGGPGGTWRVESSNGTVVARVAAFRPRLPRILYAISHLQVHLLFTRLFLLQLHGRTPPPAASPTSSDRYRAATVDLALCFTLGRLVGLRPRTLLGVITGYHIACWSTSGRTLGGLVTHQRVVSIDGKRLTPQQSVLRLLAAPLALVARRPVHDEIAGSEVIAEK